jgi:hypothetical protein
MKKVVDRKNFAHEVVVIDDTRFVKCVFESCTLRYCGTDCELDDCMVSSTCSWSFGGPAYRTVLLLKQFGMIKAARMLETKNEPNQIN